MRNVFRALGEDGQLYFAPSANFSISFHDTGTEVLMWSSDGIVDTIPAVKIDRSTGLHDKNMNPIFEGDIVYLAGYGDYVCEFPFLELYEAAMENDIGSIKGNIHQHKELLEK